MNSTTSSLNDSAEVIRHGLDMAEIFLIKNAHALNAPPVLSAIKEAQAVIAVMGDVNDTNVASKDKLIGLLEESSCSFCSELNPLDAEEIISQYNSIITSMGGDCSDVADYAVQMVAETPKIPTTTPPANILIGCQGEFDKFVIQELGPLALTDIPISIHDAAKKAFFHCWELFQREISVNDTTKERCVADDQWAIDAFYEGYERANADFKANGFSGLKPIIGGIRSLLATVNAPKWESSEDKTCWFVESRINDEFDGWWTAPEKGIGGWRSQDPNEAKRYTKAEAEAVAYALSYFPAPFRFSNWVATEHVFMSNRIEDGNSNG